MSSPTPKTVTPIIAVPSVDLIRRFYTDSLGFSHLRGMMSDDGELEFCTVAKDGARLMFARAAGGSDDGGAATPSVATYMEVAGVERYFAQVSREDGVTIAEPLATQWWGDRTFKVRDPYGHGLWFFETIAKPIPPKGVRIV